MTFQTVLKVQIFQSLYKDWRVFLFIINPLVAYQFFSKAVPEKNAFFTGNINDYAVIGMRTDNVLKIHF